MGDLNDNSFNLILKKGTTANLSLATTELQEGEPAYTTDSKQLYIGDGSDKNRIGLPNTSSAADPTTTDLPRAGDASIHKNTDSGKTILAYNDSGSIDQIVIGDTTGTNTGDETATRIGTLINGSDNKDTPVDADLIAIADSAASYILKKLTWQNLKAAAKAYFDTLYASITGTREKLSAARTYYVRTDGNDSNDGLTNSSGGAFLTIQKAIDTAAGLDFNSQTVTIQIGDGTYTQGLIIKNLLGGGVLVLQGNNATPSNVHLSVTSSTTIAIYGPQNTEVHLKDFKATNITSGYNISAFYAGITRLYNLDFGASSSYQVRAAYGAYVQQMSPCTISGSAQSFVFAGMSGTCNMNANTLTLTGTPNFSVGFAQVLFGVVLLYSMTFTGSATGPRYLAVKNGVIDTNTGDVNYLPGDSAGSTSSGGQYL